MGFESRRTEVLPSVQALRLAQYAAVSHERGHEMTKTFTDNQTCMMDEMYLETKRELHHLMQRANRTFWEWYFPENSPVVNKDLGLEIIRGLAAMKSPKQIAGEVYSAHSN